MKQLISFDGVQAQGPWKEVAPDILCMPFWTPEFCREIIDASNFLNEFKPLDSDLNKNTAPGQELRINRISPIFAENYERDVLDRLCPVIKKFWWPITLGKLRMPFVIKYTMETQRSMDPHHDAALVSLVVKLNDDYTGGALTFPRQHWDSNDVPVGSVILFPSVVTHVHWVSPIESGERYSFTGWIASRSNPPHDAIS